MQEDLEQRIYEILLTAPENGRIRVYNIAELFWSLQNPGDFPQNQTSEVEAAVESLMKKGLVKIYAFHEAGRNPNGDSNGYYLYTVTTPNEIAKHKCKKT